MKLNITEDEQEIMIMALVKYSKSFEENNVLLPTNRMREELRDKMYTLIDLQGRLQRNLENKE